ncbi:hypothetical protein FBU59_004822 [Linderina macrospora]|uniref:Uncharacterized protein n=1 Tax=Linderina macrospora TaxID=4868 RepID=A0ACC1J4B8_9FUNG|nr:hypothetical protein FBU59_004822 [Linderina macrospora]
MRHLTKLRGEEQLTWELMKAIRDKQKADDDTAEENSKTPLAELNTKVENLREMLKVVEKKEVVKEVAKLVSSMGRLDMANDDSAELGAKTDSGDEETQEELWDILRGNDAHALRQRLQNAIGDQQAAAAEADNQCQIPKRQPESEETSKK